MSISFPREVANLAPRYGNLMHMYMQHDSVLCIQTMIRKLVYLSFYDPQCGRCHTHCTSICTPLFPPINEQPANVRKYGNVLWSGTGLQSQLLPYRLSPVAEARNILHPSHRPPDCCRLLGRPLRPPRCTASFRCVAPGGASGWIGRWRRRNTRRRSMSTGEYRGQGSDWKSSYE